MHSNIYGIILSLISLLCQEFENICYTNKDEITAE